MSGEIFLRALLETLAKSLPQGTGPAGLRTGTLPDEADGVIAVLDRLPAEVAGMVRTLQFDQTSPYRYTAVSGETGPHVCSPLRLQARDISGGFALCPRDCTAEHFIAMLALGAGGEAVSAGRTGSFRWVQWSMACRTSTSHRISSIFSLSWGHTGSQWVFSAQADTAEKLEVLVTAFMAASTPRH